jgi:GldM C-terminal domain
MSCNLFAQIKITTRGDSLFYIGLDNEVTIKSSTIPVQKLSIKVEGGIVSGKPGRYNVTCVTPNKNTAIQVLYKRKVIAEKKVEIVRISEPVVYVSGDTAVTGGFISKKHLLTFDSLVVKLNVSFLKMSIVHFQFKRISNGVVADSLYNHSSYFLSPLKNVLQKASKGDIIFFENAYSTGPDNNALIHDVIKLTVTD